MAYYLYLNSSSKIDHLFLMNQWLVHCFKCFGTIFLTILEESDNEIDYKNDLFKDYSYPQLIVFIF